jgi:hypothetical protein
VAQTGRERQEIPTQETGCHVTSHIDRARTSARTKGQPLLANMAAVSMNCNVNRAVNSGSRTCCGASIFIPLRVHAAQLAVAIAAFRRVPCVISCKSSRETALLYAVDAIFRAKHATPPPTPSPSRRASRMIPTAWAFVHCYHCNVTEMSRLACIG